jgi:hypothetical protein
MNTEQNLEIHKKQELRAGSPAMSFSNRLCFMNLLVYIVVRVDGVRKCLDSGHQRVYCSSLR